MTLSRPEHSPLGASGAERWMRCPGSVTLLKHLQLPESDDPSYRKEGTAMHAAAEHCLSNDVDTWEITGQEFEGVVIDVAMAASVQVYVDYCRPLMEGALRYHIEYPVSSPVHPLFYGRLDFAAEQPDLIHIVDLKGGEGIQVDPDDNPQLKYYAFGLIDANPQWPDDLGVRLTIGQPRIHWAVGGMVRSWDTTVGAIRQWVAETLVPAMLATEYDHTLDAGPWCRFCPAKLVCPLLTSLFGAAAKSNPKEIVNLSDVSLGRSYQYLQGVEFYVKAMKSETLRRLNSAHEVPGTKLVNKKADRVWKEGADDLARAKFGDAVMEPPKFKGPPAIEKLPGGKDFVREFAYTPTTGVTVALESDPRIAVKVQTSTEAFAGAVAALED